MSEGEGYCFACGFALGFLDIEFGARSAVMERLADAAGVLTRKERHGIEVKLDRFEERLNGFVKAGNVIEGTTVTLDGELTLPARSAVVLELH